MTSTYPSLTRRTSGRSSRRLAIVSAEGGGWVTAADHSADAQGLRLRGETVPVEGVLHLVAHPRLPYVFATSSAAGGSIVSLQVTRHGLGEVVGVADSQGALPCHLEVAPSDQFLLCANYVGGTVSVHQITDSGALTTTDVVTPTGRSRSSRPHQSRFITEHAVLVSLLGYDTLAAYTLEGTGRLVLDHQRSVRCEPGSGPRNITTDHRGWVWCANELASTVARYRRDADGCRLIPAGHGPSTGSPAAGREHRNYPSVIISAQDGQWVYTANRGLDTVSAFSTVDGPVVPATEVSSGGRWPMAMAEADGRLYVANQHTDSIAVFGLNKERGILPVPDHVLDVPQPVSLAMLPRLPWTRRA